MQLFEKYMAERSGFHFYLCNLGNGENVLWSSKAVVMKHIHNEQGQQLYLFTNSQITNLLTCDPESSLLRLTWSFCLSSWHSWRTSRPKNTNSSLFLTLEISVRALLFPEFTVKCVQYCQRKYIEITTHLSMCITCHLICWQNGFQKVKRQLLYFINNLYLQHMYVCKRELKLLCPAMNEQNLHVSMLKFSGAHTPLTGFYGDFHFKWLRTKSM